MKKKKNEMTPGKDVILSRGAISQPCAQSAKMESLVEAQSAATSFASKSMKRVSAFPAVCVLCAFLRLIGVVPKGDWRDCLCLHNCFLYSTSKGERPFTYLSIHTVL